MKTRAWEILLLILMVVTNAFVLFISFKQNSPMVIEIISDEEKLREKSCNTDNHLLIQLIWVFLLMIFTSIQAIRARHLPENFKETRIIMLSNVLCCVIAGNTVWLSFFQVRQVRKSIFLFYAIFCLNSINFIILYSFKVYTILFAPQKNTKQYFNLVLRKKIEKQTKMQTSL